MARKPIFSQMLDNEEIRKILGIDKKLIKLSNFTEKEHHGAIYRCECGYEFKVTSKNGLPRFLENPCESCCHKIASAEEDAIKHIWGSMMARCNNPNTIAYKYYGGRGITVCSKWKKLRAFKEWAMRNGYQLGLSIERIDVNGNYCPDNCKWIPLEDQAKNTRRSYKNKFLTYNGTTLNYIEWSELTGIPVEFFAAKVAAKRKTSLEQINPFELEIKHPKGKLVTIDGETNNLTFWLSKYGISRESYRNRIKKGMTPVEAITTPKFFSKNNQKPIDKIT